jgi:hypothetical protein
MSAFKGCTLPIDFPAARTSDGKVIDLTSAVISCKAKLKDGTPPGTEIPASFAAITSGREGTARAVFSAVQTLGLTVGATYRYDAIATLPTGEVVALGGGAFVVEELLSID